MIECPKATVAYAAAIISERLAVAVDRLTGEHEIVRGIFDATWGRCTGIAPVGGTTSDSIKAVTDKI